VGPTTLAVPGFALAIRPTVPKVSLISYQGGKSYLLGKREIFSLLVPITAAATRAKIRTNFGFHPRDALRSHSCRLRRSDLLLLTGSVGRHSGELQLLVYLNQKRPRFFGVSLHVVFVELLCV